MKFVLDQELDTFTCTRISESLYIDGVDCKRSRLYFSIGDIRDTYTFYGISTENAGSFSFSDSIISAKTSDKINNTSYMFSPNSTPFAFDCCKLDIEMEQGKLFDHSIVIAAINFDEFNWIELYTDIAGEPKYIPGGTLYPLAGTDWDAVKIIVNSNVKEPTDDADNSLAIIAAIVASMLLAIFAIFILFFRRRRYDED